MSPAVSLRANLRADTGIADGGHHRSRRRRAGHATRHEGPAPGAVPPGHRPATPYSRARANHRVPAVECRRRPLPPGRRRRHPLPLRSAAPWSSSCSPAPDGHGPTTPHRPRPPGRPSHERHPAGSPDLTAGSAGSSSPRSATAPPNCCSRHDPTLEMWAGVLFPSHKVRPHGSRHRGRGACSGWPLLVT